MQYEYISEELKDIFALADVVLSRAGANAICELLYLHKPNLLVPLSLNASRGDQILNARSFTAQGFSLMIEEENMTDELLISTLLTLLEEKEKYQRAMAASPQSDAVGFVADMLEELCEKKQPRPLKPSLLPQTKTVSAFAPFQGTVPTKDRTDFT